MILDPRLGAINAVVCFFVCETINYFSDDIFVGSVPIVRARLVVPHSESLSCRTVKYVYSGYEFGWIDSIP